MVYGETETGKRIKATPQAISICPYCKAKLIPKCGDINVWHWAHTASDNCDPWRKGETAWHLTWKSMFDENQTEVIIEKDGVKHIADARIELANGSNLFVEFQNSPIAQQEIKKREEFYGDMAWVFNIQDCYPGRFNIIQQEEHSIFIWKRARSIFSANKIFLDYKIGSKLLFFVKNLFDSTPLTGWGLVIASQELLNFAVMEGTYNGFYSESHKEIQAMFEVGRHNISAEYKTKYYFSVKRQFKEDGFLTDRQIDYLAGITKFYGDCD